MSFVEELVSRGKEIRSQEEVGDLLITFQVFLLRSSYNVTPN